MGYLANVSALSQVPDCSHFTPSVVFVPQNMTRNKKCSPCSWHCQSAYSHQLSTVACLRCSALLQTCTCPHLSYAWGRTGWPAAARVMPNASASAAGWIHPHLCPPFRLLCAHVKLVWCSQASEFKTTSVSTLVSFWKGVSGCFFYTPPALAGHPNTYLHHSRAFFHALNAGKET